MTEFSLGPELAPKKEATLDSVKDFLVDLVENPLGGDPLNSMLPEALTYLAQKDKRFQHLIESFIDNHNKNRLPDDPLFDDESAANKLLRGIQHQFLLLNRTAERFDRSSPKYPEDFDSVKKLIYGTERIIDRRADFIEGALAMYKVCSTVPNRYVGPKLIFSFYYDDRFRDVPINHLDIGASVGIGCKKYLMGEPFREFKLMVPDARTHKLAHEQVLGPAFNALANRPVEFNRSVAMDIMRGRDMQEWARSCSFYFNELMDPSRTEEFDRLTESSPEGFDSFTGDITQLSSIEELEKKYSGEKFHLITFLTVMYQLSEHQQQVALEHAKRLLAPGGIIVVQDKIPGGHYNHDYAYRSWVIDSLRPDDPPEEWLRWKTGRCDEVQVTGNLLARG